MNTNNITSEDVEKMEILIVALKAQKAEIEDYLKNTIDSNEKPLLAKQLLNFINKSIYDAEEDIRDFKKSQVPTEDVVKSQLKEITIKYIDEVYELQDSFNSLKKMYPAHEKYMDDIVIECIIAKSKG